MRGLSLFSGVGGLDIAFEMAGGTTVGFVEIDPFCRRVLAKHWPDVPCLEDIRDVRGDEFGPIDILYGGFPCTDISGAGLKAGIDGEQSGLWREFARLIGLVRPGVVVVENVAALLNRGLGTVLGDLAALGFDAEWSVLSACAMGAPHTRERLCIVAYAHGKYGQTWLGHFKNRTAAHEQADNTKSLRVWHVPFTGVRGVAHGLPANVDRLRVLGNAVVPAVFLPVFQAIMADAHTQEGVA